MSKEPSAMSDAAGKPLRKDPARKVKGAPPQFGRAVLPHIVTFQGLISSVARAYKNPDEAIKNSLDNARYMRNDISIMECLESRQRSTALLDWHLEVDGPKMPKHEALKDKLTRCVKATPRFTEYRRCLLEALWYGRYANQNQFGWKIGDGRRDLVIKHWTPVNGDKLVFRQDDGTGKYPPNQIGIRVGYNYNDGDLVDGRTVETTGAGLAAFLSPDERLEFALHRHMIEDAAFESPLDAGAINGIGIRSRIYWSWFQKQEIMAMLMEYVERSALGFEIWTYPEGNPEAQAATEDAAKNRVGRRNIILFPKPIGDDQNAYGVEHYEPSAAGLDALTGLVKNLFGHQIKRYILGQTLSSEADATGLGSGVADLQLATLLDIVKYDATNLEETVTTDVVDPLKTFNDPSAAGVDVHFKINTQTPDVEQKLASYERAYNMGARLKESEVMDSIGASIPTETDRVLQNPQLATPDAAAAGATGSAAVSASNATIDPENFKAAMGDAGLQVQDAESEQVVKEELSRQGLEVGPNPSSEPARAVERYSREDLPAMIEAAAADTAQEPSEAQRTAGNYRKGRFNLHGLPITIETPKGAIRRGTDSDGNQWEQVMPNHYGYIRRTESEADGDHVDLFIGPDPHSELAFVVDQVKSTGRFDEHKVMLGWHNAEEARQAYLAAYSDDWQGLGEMTPLTIPALLEWLGSGDTGKPIAKYRRVGPVERYGWEEGKHPRADDGKFGSGGSSDVDGNRLDMASTMLAAWKKRGVQFRVAGDKLQFDKADQIPAAELEDIKEFKAELMHLVGGQSAPPPPKKSNDPTGLENLFRGLGNSIGENLKDAWWKSISAGKGIPPQEQKSMLGQFVNEVMRRGYSDEASVRKAMTIGAEPIAASLDSKQKSAALTKLINQHFPPKGPAKHAMAGEPDRYRDARHDKKESGPRWITIGGDHHDGEGGTPVLVGGDGKIVGGPKGLKGKHLGELDRDVAGTDQDQRTKANRESFNPDDFGGYDEADEKEFVPKNRFEAEVANVAGDYSISPHDLIDAAEFVWREKRQQAESRETAKASARAKTGLTQQDISRLENSGLDYTAGRKAGGHTGQKLAHFDAYAQEIAREHPELGLGDPDDPNADFGSALWHVIAEGKQSLPPKHDPDILREAANVVLANNGQYFDSGFAEPFKRSGVVERYAKQVGLWSESDHPRDDKGVFAEADANSTVAHEATKIAVRGNLDQAGHVTQKAAKQAHALARKQFLALAAKHDANGNLEAAKGAKARAAHHATYENIHAANMRNIAGMLKSDAESFALKNERTKPAKPEFGNNDGKQKQLLSGLNAMPGQQDLFEGMDSQSDELSNRFLNGFRKP